MPSKLDEMISSSHLKGIVMSPEGTEEKLIRETSFTITLTEGGKYRLYHQYTDENGETKRTPVSLFDDLKSAEQHLHQMMGFLASMEIDPERTIKALMNGLTRKSG